VCKAYKVPRVYKALWDLQARQVQWVLLVHKVLKAIPA
jgi:hypothetical protein